MLSKAERQRNALLAEREAECRRLRMEAARYRAYVQRWADIRCLNGGDCGECASCEARHALAATEREPSDE
jgi:hypothetical protein